jgi:cell division protein FtsB
MLKEISKKLTMKKTFFTTQLEGFFNSITQEYQDLIHQIELEKRVLEEKIAKLEKDIKNLVDIKNRYERNLDIDKKLIKDYKETLANTKHLNSPAYIEKLKKENELLREEIEKLKLSRENPKEVDDLKDEVKKLKSHLAKGISAYNDNINSQKSEELIKEITKQLKK